MAESDLEKKLRRKRPELVPYLQIPELKRILLRGVKKGWDSTRFASEIQGSRWYRKHNARERTWITMTEADQKAARREQQEGMREWYNDLLDANANFPAFKKAAEKVASGKMTVAEWQRKVRNSKAYRNRFPGIFAQRARGVVPLDEGTYKRYEADFRHTLQSYGLPQDFFNDPQDFKALFARGLDPKDFSDRMETYYRLTNRYGGAVRKAFQKHLGVSLSDVDAFGVVTGLRPELAREYANATGTQLFEPTQVPLETRKNVATRDVQEAFEDALADEKAQFTSGGSTITGSQKLAAETF